MRVLGIDPGLSGGIAVIDGATIISAIDIPVAGEAAKRRVDVSAFMRFLRVTTPEHAFIERAQAFKDQGASSGFIYGRAVGALEACVLAAEIPLSIIEVTAWKRFHSLGGGDKSKEAARQLVLQLYPKASSLFEFKKHQHRAEAVLIARFGSVKLATRTIVYEPIDGTPAQAFQGDRR